MSDGLQADSVTAANYSWMHGILPGKSGRSDMSRTSTYENMSTSAIAATNRGVVLGRSNEDDLALRKGAISCGEAASENIMRLESDF